MEAIRKKELYVSETFISLQGEGKTAGSPAVFLRLTGCNLLCGGRKDSKEKGSTWICDSIGVWTKGEKKEFPDVLSEEQIDKLKEGFHLIITGGEPLLQQEAIHEYLIWLFRERNCHPILEIETNGTIFPMPGLRTRVQHWNLSPKLTNSGETKDKRRRREVLEEFAKFDSNQVIFKFVVSNEEDIIEIQEDFFNPRRVIRNKKQVWLMPACDTRENLLQSNQRIAELSIKNGYNFTTRLQIEIWDKTTGV